MAAMSKKVSLTSRTKFCKGATLGAIFLVTLMKDIFNFIIILNNNYFNASILPNILHDVLERAVEIR